MVYSMKVKVKLLGILSYSFPAFANFKMLELEEGATIEELYKKLGLSKDLVGIVTINGEIVKDNYTLKPNDEIIFFPQVSGG